MALSSITYEEISFPKIENGLKQKIRTIIPNTYISPTFTMQGNECVRINLTESNSIEQHVSFEEREYLVTIRYYTKADMSKENINREVKARVDKLKKRLIDSQYNSSGTDGADNKWISLSIPSILYDIRDEENEDEAKLYIAEMQVLLNNTNSY